MKFSPQQDEALKAVSRWLRLGNPQVFRLFGYAGTGKTTLARYFAEHVEGEVQFVAFTGKAAQVLRSSGATNACTIHSLIYRPRGEEEVKNEMTGKVSFVPSFSLNTRSQACHAQLIVVDECSMIDESLGQDLLSFGKPVLVLGDPAQLPPIAGGGFFTQCAPDFLLTEVHRQAFDNPVVRLAFQVRQGQSLFCGDFGSSRVIFEKDLNPDCLLSADQLLSGLNSTRISYNRKLRVLKGFSSVSPESGDKLVCLRNNFTKGLLNGSLWRVHSASSASLEKNYLNMLILPEEETSPSLVKIKLSLDIFRKNDSRLSWKARRIYDEFDYGYALTVHKAQGSQWNNVVLIDESFAFGDSAKLWLYTAITRAKDKITIVR